MYVDEAAAVAEFKIRMTTKSLVLKRRSASRSSGEWRDDDYDVLENGVVVGRIFKSYDDLVDHCCAAWNKLVDQPWRIMSIGLRQWAHGF